MFICIYISYIQGILKIKSKNVKFIVFGDIFLKYILDVMYFE